MKTFFTLLISILFLQVIAAPPAQSRLSISSFTTANNMRVVIDGRNINARPANDGTLTIQDIRPGYHRIQVYQQADRYYGNNRRQNQAMQLVFDNNILIKSNFHVDICINRFGKAFVDESPVYGYYTDNNSYPYNQAMDTRDFAQMKLAISRESFENTRLAIAKQAIQGKFITVLQVKEVMQLMSFENNKLDLAKFYYAFCTDKNNYYQVADALAFNNNREDLMRFLQQNR